MPAYALAPALALIGGAILGVEAAWPSGAGLALLAVAWGVSVSCWVLGRTVVVVAAATIGCTGAGVVLGGHAFGEIVGATILDAAREADTSSRARDPVVVTGRLHGDAARTAYGAAFLLEVITVEARGTARRARGTLRVSVGGAMARDASLQWRDGRIVRTTVLLRHPQPFRNPGVSDSRRALARRGITLLASVKSGALVDVVAAGRWHTEAAAAARAWVRERTSAAFGPDRSRSKAIVAAILIGDRTGLDDETEDLLQRAGTFHVIAISGGNVALLVVLVLGFLRLAGVPPRVSAVTAALVVGSYGLLVQGGSSVGRATAMAAGWLLARAAGLRADPLALLGTAALLLATAFPLVVFDVGFALTCGATLGILAGAARPLVAQLARARSARGGVLRAAVRRATVGLATATVCAELAVFPIAACAFSLVTAAGLLLNFVAVPAMALIQVAGLAVLVLDGISEQAVALPSAIAHAGVEALFESARLVELAPWASRRVPAPSLALVAAYYAAWLCWFGHPARRWLRIAAAAAIVLTGAAIWIGIAPGIPAARAAVPTSGEASEEAPRGGLSVTFLDVGQGDATFVRFPDGASMLIDAGGLAGSSFDVGARVVSPALWAMRTRRLSWLVLTHGDPDHVGGAAAVLEDFRPAEIWEGVPVTGHEPTARLRALAARRRLAWRRVEAGDVTRAGPVSVNVWHPAAADWERRRVRNDDSIVLELRHGEVSIVLPGDAGREVEGQIAPALARAGIRIVKAGHHGSAGATSIEWLAALRPQAVVVSAGRDNRFGHPAPAVLARCREAGAAVFRTDRDGAVQVVSSGRRAAVRMWDGSRWVERATYKASPRGDERGGPRRAETR